MTTLYGTVLQPCSADKCDVRPHSGVRIESDGRIADIGPAKGKQSDTIGDTDCWIIPGFIDAHLHLPQWDRRGIDPAQGESLFDWLERIIYPAEARLKDADLAERLAEDFVSGMLANGTTTVAAFGSPFAAATDRVFEVFARRGLRAVYGMTLNDANCPGEIRTPADAALDQSRELAAKWHGANDGLPQYAFSPRMAWCCTEKLMRGAGALAKMQKCYIQTHVAESVAEVSAVRERFPDQLDDVDVLAEMGLLTPRTLLGHGVCLTEPQRHQVAETKTSVIHCPTANLFLESGLMDYVAHRKSGLKVALGSGVAGGYEPFMPQVAVACLQTAKAVKVHGIPRGSYAVPTAAEAWWLLTAGGAAALGMGDRVGSIAPGVEADWLVVRPESWIAELPTEQQISALLYTLRPQHIEHVFIAGKRVGP